MVCHLVAGSNTSGVAVIYFRLAARCVAFLAGLMMISAPARAEWWEAETAHFVVRSEASEAATREFALELERFDRALRLLQGMSTEEEDIGRANKPTVYRFGYAKDIAIMIGASGSGVAGFFIPRAGASVGFAPVKSAKIETKSASMREDRRNQLDPRSVLFHEYTHYFMMQHFPGAYPRWYVEGYAELMATMRINDDGSYHVGDPPQYRAFQIFEMRDFPLKEMLDPDYRLSGLDGLQHYATGWLLTHYMSFDPARLEKLRAYLKAIGKGENGLEVATREFGDLGELQSQLRKYKKGPFPGFDISAGNVPPKVALRRITGIEEAAIREEMRLMRGPLDTDDAKDIALDVGRLLASDADNLHLLGLLGRAQIGARQYAEAEGTGAKIVALDEANRDGWMIRAAAGLGLATSDPVKAVAARDHATQAAKLDRTDPRPLILYYLSYIRAQETPSETAVLALETAFKQAGSDATYRLLVAHQMLLDNRLDTARHVLMPIAFRGHRTAEPKDETDPTLPRVLKLIDAGDRDAALAMTGKMIADEEDEG